MIKISDILCMNGFLRGMATIGELYPPTVSSYELPQYSKWQWVANSFAQAGVSLWFALKEAEKHQMEIQAGRISGNS